MEAFNRTQKLAMKRKNKKEQKKRQTGEILRNCKASNENQFNF